MVEKYVPLEMETILFQNEDVITKSPPLQDYGDED